MKCIYQNARYIVTDGEIGLPNASKIHSQAVDIYFNDREKFNAILKDFQEKY